MGKGMEPKKGYDYKKFVDGRGKIDWGRYCDCDRKRNRCDGNCVKAKAENDPQEA